MNYREFVSAVEGKMKLYTGKEIRISIHESVKNNGVERRGITFLQEGVNISPTIYLEEYYEQYQEGRELNEICSCILALYEKVKAEKSLDTGQILCYEKVKGNLLCKLINFPNNRNQLEHSPKMLYKKYLDLAVTIYLMVELKGFGTAAMQVTEEYLSYWEVTEEALFADAWANTKRVRPVWFRTMRSVIADMVEPEQGKREAIKKGVLGIGEAEEKDTMYILTNQARHFGAVCLLYESTMEQLADFLEENYYVIPSSVHEVIIVPESGSPGDEVLNAMIREINATQVEREEVLAGHCYYYDRRRAVLASGNYKK